jgi:hypothetical protein
MNHLFDVFTDIGRSVEHATDMFRDVKRYHGKSCLWCRNVVSINPTLLQLKYKHPTGSDFKCSQEDVKKRALIVSVDYLNNQKQAYTSGIKLKDFLENNYLFKDIKHLSDVPTSVNLPTKKNIKTHVEWLLHDTKAGDLLIFAFIGEGKQDFLLANDFRTGGLITADDLFISLFSKIPLNVHLTAIIDSGQNAQELQLNYKVNKNALLCFENRSKRTTGTIICISAQTRKTVGLLTMSIIECVTSKNLRLSVQNLLYELDVLKPNLSTSRHVVPNQYYFCLSNK